MKHLALTILLLAAGSAQASAQYLDEAECQRPGLGDSDEASGKRQQIRRKIGARIEKNLVVKHKSIKFVSPNIT